MPVPPTDASVTLRGPFGVRRAIDLAAAAGGRATLMRLPWCHRVLLENVLRQPDPEVRRAGRHALLGWLETGRSEAEIPFAPLRILMHDTTCGPALVDIAAMRDALAEAGGNPALLNPAVPVATSTDHSLPVDVSARPEALRTNMANEMARNAERYRFMKWAAGSIEGFRVSRPAPASCTPSTWSGWPAWSPPNPRVARCGRCLTRWWAPTATRR